jgi:hypothetical protein
VTKNDLLANGHFTFIEKTGARHHVRIDFKAAEHPYPAQRFVYLVNGNGQQYYTGKLRPNGGLKWTDKSKIPEDAPLFKLLHRTLKAVHEGRHNEVTKAGYRFLRGTPLENEEGAKAAPTSTPEPKKEEPRPTALAPDRKRPDIGRCVLLFYYIPMVQHNGRLQDLVGNPSATLRRIGIRLDGSVWCIQESRVPWPIVDTMLKAEGPNLERVTCHVVKFDKEDNDRLTEIATNYLKDELSEVQKRLLASVHNAETAYLEAIEGGTGANKALTTFQKRVAAAVGSARRYREDYTQAARNFGVSADLGSNFTKVGTLVEAIGSLAKDRAASYAKAVELAKGTELETAAKDGDVPVEVLIDRLEEEGKDVSELRTAFGHAEEYDLTTAE